MSMSPQKAALTKYRTRLAQSGMARFEVLALDTDRDLIRGLAKRLAANDAGAARLRAAMRQDLPGEKPRTGGILAALRRSPLVGADIDVTRETAAGRDIDL